jgi:Icc-related predicted phosphoesterase
MIDRDKSAGIRLQILSDLHTEFGPYAELPQAEMATDADAVVLAGDIARAPDAVGAAARMFPDVPLILVAGNHESYETGLTIDEGLNAMRRAALGDSSTEFRPIHVLEDEEVVVTLRGVLVRFLGCTLWTDFALFDDPARDQTVVENGLNDFIAIRGQITSLSKSLFRGGISFDSAEWLDRHNASKEFLRSRLSVFHDGPTIVMTHHLPSMRSVMQRYRENHLSAGFASNLDDIIGMGATLWVHGHTHDSCRWRAPGGTLVVCNPAGYARQTRSGGAVRENSKFDPKLVIDISRDRDGSWQAE